MELARNGSMKAKLTLRGRRGVSHAPCCVQDGGLRNNPPRTRTHTQHAASCAMRHLATSHDVVTRAFSMPEIGRRSAATLNQKAGWPVDVVDNMEACAQKYYVV